MTSEMLGLARQQHDQSIPAERDPAVRGRSVAERLEHVPELLLRLLGHRPSTSKTARCTSGWLIRMLPPPISTPLRTRS